MIAKTLLNPSERAMHCLVLNPTDRAVRLRAGTPLGSLHPIIAATKFDAKPMSVKITRTSKMFRTMR
jgi:hypothetical protein